MGYNQIKYKQQVFLSSSQLTRNSRVFYNDYVNKRGHLTEKEEKVLAKKVKEGDKKAYRKFIQYNQGLVYNIAKHYVRDSIYITLDDLLQEANIGMIEAFWKWDPEKARFSTYAVYTMKRYCLNYIAKIKYQSEGKRLNTVGRYKKMIEKIIHETGSVPLNEEVYEKLGYRKQQIEFFDFFFATGGIKSIEAPIGEDLTLKEIYPLQDYNYEDFDNRRIRQTVWQILDGFTDYQRRVAIMFWGLDGKDPMMGKEIAEKLGVKYQAIERLLQRIREKIRAYRNSPVIQDLLSA